MSSAYPDTGFSFFPGSLESSAFRILDRPKGKRTQNIFCPIPPQRTLPNYLPYRVVRLAEDCSRLAVHKTKTSYKTGETVGSTIHFPSDRLRQLAIYHSSGPWQSALKSFRQGARGHNPEKEKPTTPRKAYSPR